MIERFKNSKAFTLIELIVVVGVIGILVLIASSNLSGQTKDAKLKAGLADMKIVADATELYNIDNEDWPRLTDVPYTSEQLERYSNSIYDRTGKKVSLPATANFYDIDYDKLSQYTKAPVNKENYILQNPAGKVYYMRDLSDEGKARVDYSTNKQANQSLPSQLTLSSISDTSVIVTSDADTEVKVGGSEWEPSGHKFTGLSPETEYVAYARLAATESHLASQAISENFTTENSGLYDFAKHTFTNAGQTGHTGPSQSMLNNAYRGSEVEGYVASDNGIQLWTVPKTGTYRIEAYGARGGQGTQGTGGKGAIMKGDFNLTKEESLKILVGQVGGNNTVSNSSYYRTGGGGGGTFVVLSDNSPVIIAGGGGGDGRDGRRSSSRDATTSESGRGGYSSQGGTSGSGGKVSRSSYEGGGGGGLLGNGEVHYNGGGTAYGGGGNSFINKGEGGSKYTSSDGIGGFGGGGGNGHGGSGGGGGYSGGGSGGIDYGSGGGGGSFNSGANQANSVGNTGHGKVIITYIGE